MNRIVILGATSGIGLEIAKLYIAAGGQVVAADGNPLTELIRRYYPDAKTIASVLPEAHATIDPDTVDDARDRKSVV